MHAGRRTLIAAAFAAAALAVFSGTALADAPANDDFATATTVTTPRLEDDADLREATREAAEPTVGASDSDHTIWYSWTAPSEGVMRASTCMPSDDLDLVAGISIGVYTGDSVDALDPVASSTGGCPAGSDNAQTDPISVTEGQTYRIQIGAASDLSLSASYVHLAIDFGPALPDNDDWNDAASIPTSLPQTVEADNFLATREANEPDEYPGHWTNSVWFKWTPDRDGTVSIDTCDTPYTGQDDDSAISVYDADGNTPALDSLVGRSFNDDGCDTRGLLSHSYTQVSSGTTYWIRVSNYAALIGSPYVLNLHWVDGVENARAPSINSDQPQVGSTLSGDSGYWGADESFSEQLQWERCDEAGDNCFWIDGATGSDYTPTSEDIGSTLRFEVTVATSDASVTLDSAPTEVVDETPANDMIAGATDLGSDAEVFKDDDNNFATTEDDEPSIDGNAPQQTVWYRWTAPSTGDFAVGACDGGDSNVDLVLGIYTGDGTTVGSTSVATADGGCDAGDNDRPRTLLAATGGTTYWIQIGSKYGGSTRFQLQIEPAAAPHFTGNASLAGSAVEGGSLTAVPGGYTSALTATTSYEWSLCDSNGDNCDLLGDSDPQIDIGSDAGKRLLVSITVTNAIGSDNQTQLSPTIQADSDGDGVGDNDDVCPAETGSSPPGNGCQPSVVSNTAAPAITGDATVDSTLSTTDGQWQVEHNPLPLSYAYHWFRCNDAAITDCGVIDSETSSSYTLTPADLGKYVFVAVTASNDDDTEFAISNAIGPVAAASGPTGGTGSTGGGSGGTGGGSGGGGGGGSTTPPVDPFPKPKLPKSLGTIKLKSGKVNFKKLKLTCGAAAIGSCKGSIVIAVGGKKTTIKLSVKPGAKLATNFKLSSAAQKKIKKGKKAKATIKLTFGAPGFPSKTASTTAVLTK